MFLSLSVCLCFFLSLSCHLSASSAPGVRAKVDCNCITCLTGGCKEQNTMHLSYTHKCFLCSILDNASKDKGMYTYSVYWRSYISEKRLHCRGASGPSWPIRLLVRVAYPVSPSSLSQAECCLSDSSLLHIGLFSLPMGLICASCF